MVYQIKQFGTQNYLISGRLRSPFFVAVQIREKKLPQTSSDQRNGEADALKQPLHFLLETLPCSTSINLAYLFAFYRKIS